MLPQHRVIAVIERLRAKHLRTSQALAVVHFCKDTLIGQWQHTRDLTAQLHCLDE